jgi:hypothetical protein
MSNKDEESKHNGKNAGNLCGDISPKYTFPTRGCENFAIRTKGD